MTVDVRDRLAELLGQWGEKVRRVRTPAGAAWYDQPIGSIIVRDAAHPLTHVKTTGRRRQGMEIVSGSDGRTYRVGRHAGHWVAVDSATHRQVASGQTADDVFYRLDRYVGGRDTESTDDEEDLRLLPEEDLQAQRDRGRTQAAAEQERRATSAARNARRRELRRRARELAAGQTTGVSVADHAEQLATDEPDSDAAPLQVDTRARAEALAQPDTQAVDAPDAEEPPAAEPGTPDPVPTRGTEPALSFDTVEDLRAYLSSDNPEQAEPKAGGNLTHLANDRRRRVAAISPEGRFGVARLDGGQWQVFAASTGIRVDAVDTRRESETIAAELDTIVDADGTAPVISNRIVDTWRSGGGRTLREEVAAAVARARLDLGQTPDDADSPNVEREMYRLRGVDPTAEDRTAQFTAEQHRRLTVVEAVRNASDDELEQRLSAAAAVSGDEFELNAVLAEFDRRQAEAERAAERRERQAQRQRERQAERAAAKSAEDAAKWARYEELTDAGVDEESAVEQAYGVTVAQQRRQRATRMLRDQGYTGRGFDQLARESYRDEIARRYHAAEDATRGSLLNRQGRAQRVDPKSLFTGSEDRARKWASDELKEWWDEHGRITYDEYREQLLSGRAGQQRGDGFLR